MTQKLLYETASGCVYHWTQELSEKPGFVPYDPKPKTQAAPEPAPKPAPEPEKPAEPDVKAMAAAVLKRKLK